MQYNDERDDSLLTATDFRRESHRIDQLIWDGMALLAGERVLFCGYSNDAAWIRRAGEIGVDVHVIESDEDKLEVMSGLGLKTLRGSTTMIPARDNSFDAVVAFHYLHEIDPTFHAQIVSEIARVGKRIIVVEPAPPADPLGKRISELYSRAKFEAGAFEEYQPIDYWRKLLAMVKADVIMTQHTFTRVAPRFAIEETVSLILQAMAIEEMPAGYLEELRELARRPDARLSPLSRLVLIGAPAGRPIPAGAGTFFREPEAARPVDAARIAAAISAVAAATATAAPAAAAPAPATGSPSYMDDAEFPPVLPPPGSALPPAGSSPSSGAASPTPATAAAPPGAFTAPPASVPAPASPPPAAAPVFGMPDPTPFGAPPPQKATPFGTPCSLPEDPDPFGLSPDPEERAGFGWTWEAPDGGQPAEVPFDASDPFGTKGP